MFLDPCAKGWLNFERKCFFFSGTDTINSFTAGEAKCSSLHSSAHLASIETQEEHDWIMGEI